MNVPIIPRDILGTPTTTEAHAENVVTYRIRHLPVNRIPIKGNVTMRLDIVGGAHHWTMDHGSSFLRREDNGEEPTWNARSKVYDAIRTDVQNLPPEFLHAGGTYHVQHQIDQARGKITHHEREIQALQAEINQLESELLTRS